MSPTLPRRNNATELDAFEQVCRSLLGFDAGLSFERVDGFLCALAAGPRVPPVETWLPALAGDTFDRVFADPEDRERALRALQTRLKVLCDQLDPEALFDAPDQLRLDPLVAEWTDEHRRQLVDDGIEPDVAATIDVGGEWAAGFFDALHALPQLWTEPQDEEVAQAFGAALDQIAALGWAPGSDELTAHRAKYWPDQAPSREDLLAEACMAAQDLRMLWVDLAPVPEPRRVEAQPGRNDPCPCGSGLKYKKCHGAIAN